MLAVREENARAIALYARNGFVDDGEIEDALENAPRERLMVYAFSTDER